MALGDRVQICAGPSFYRRYGFVENWTQGAVWVRFRNGRVYSFPARYVMLAE